MSLRDTINGLALTFAEGVLQAIRSASLQDILSESGRGPARGPGRPPSTASASSAPRSGTRARRSAADIDQTVSAIVSTLKGSKSGLRAEQIRDRIGVSRKELPLAIAKALSSKQITKKGQRRATTYFAR